MIFGANGKRDIGDSHLNGLLLIDGTLGRTGAFGREGGLSIGPLELVPDVAQLEAGRSPYFTFAFSPASYARTEARALLARFAPDALAPEGLYDYPITNFAAAGLTVDESLRVSPLPSARRWASLWAQPLTATSSLSCPKGRRGHARGALPAWRRVMDAVKWERGRSERRAHGPQRLDSRRGHGGH